MNNKKNILMTLIFWGGKGCIPPPQIPKNKRKKNLGKRTMNGQVVEFMPFCAIVIKYLSFLGLSS